MGIPGITDEHLERIHLWLGPGKGSEYAYKHIPSGMMVGGKKPPEMTVFQFDEQLVAQLTEKLKEAGLITGAETQSEER